MKKNAATIAVLLALLTISLPPAFARDDEPAEWVPADALVYLGVTDVDRTWKLFQRTAGYELMNDPAAQDALEGLDPVMKFADKFKDRVAAMLEIPADQLENPFGGRLAFYVLADGADPDDAQAVFISGVGNKELMQKYYDTIVDKLKKQGKHETESVGSATVNIFEPDPERTGGSSDDDEGDDEFEDFEDFDEDFESGGGQGPFGLSESMINEQLDEIFSAESLPPKLALCLADGKFYASNVPEALQKALRQSGDTLADTDDHRALLDHLKPIGTIRMLVNVPRIIELAKADAKGEQAEEMKKWMQVLGAEGLRSLVGHIKVGASSYDRKYDMLFLMRGERSGLAKVLSMDNQPIDPPDSVSESACAYMSFNLNVPRLLDDIERMIRQSDPQAADQFRASMEAVPIAGPEPINLRKEVLDHLTGPLNGIVTIQQPVAPGSVRFLLTLGHRDQNALVRFLGNFAGMLTPRELRGTQLFDAAFPPMTVAPASDRLLAGSTPAVEAALESAAADALAETDLWHKVARQVPSEAWAVVFVDERRVMSAALDMVGQVNPSAMMMDPGLSLLGMLTGGATADMTKEQADEARKLLKYSSSSIITIATTPDGVRLTSVEMKPE